MAIRAPWTIFVSFKKKKTQRDDNQGRSEWATGAAIHRVMMIASAPITAPPPRISFAYLSKCRACRGHVTEEMGWWENTMMMMMMMLLNKEERILILILLGLVCCFFSFSKCARENPHPHRWLLNGYHSRPPPAPHISNHTTTLREVIDDDDESILVCFSSSRLLGALLDSMSNDKGCGAFGTFVLSIFSATYKRPKPPPPPPSTSFCRWAGCRG